MVSGLDDIPRAQIVDRITRNNAHHRCGLLFEQDFYTMRLNWRARTDATWIGTRMIERRFFRSAQGLRRFKAAAHPKSFMPWLDWRAQCCWETRSLIFPQRIPNSGWHFTSVGNADHIRTKVTSYSHWDHDLNHADYEIDKIEARIAKGNLSHIVVPLTHLPDNVAREPGRYAHILDLASTPTDDWLPSGAIVPDGPETNRR